MRNIIKAGEHRALVDHQNKTFVHESSRPLNTDTFYTGVDDAGNYLELAHLIGDPTTQVVYADFTTEINTTYLHEALCQWKGCTRDSICCLIVPELTPYMEGVASNWTLLPNGVIIASQGMGNIEVDVANVHPVEMTPDQDSGIRAPGYWDINLNPDGTWDYNSLTFNSEGKGVYNLFGSEVTLAQFVRKIPLLGSTSSWNILPSSDTAKIGPGMRIKLVFETRGTDHNWECCISFIMHREKI